MSFLYNRLTSCVCNIYLSAQWQQARVDIWTVSWCGSWHCFAPCWGWWMQLSHCPPLIGNCWPMSSCWGWQSLETERQVSQLQLGKPPGGGLCKEQRSTPTRYGCRCFIKAWDMRYILGMVYSVSSASCSVSLSSNLMSLNQDGSECPSKELTLSLSGDGVSENSVL